MVTLMLTRRQFVLGSLAGVGMLMLPSESALALVSTPDKKTYQRPRVWLTGNPRTGCSQLPGAEWTRTRQL